jgi:hypothetical protein
MSMDFFRISTTFFINCSSKLIEVHVDAHSASLLFHVNSPQHIASFVAKAYRHIVRLTIQSITIVICCNLVYISSHRAVHQSHGGSQ